MSTPKQYRKKPVVIEAMQWDGKVVAHHPVVEWIDTEGGNVRWSNETPQSIAIETLEGIMKADMGDFIIKGVNGEFYPCKSDIFAKTYEPAEEASK